MTSIVNFKSYNVGDQDLRPWGSYQVIASGVYENGEEYCEKLIKVSPYKLLSLQAHVGRREKWTVKSGTLTVILNGHAFDAEAGQTVIIPLSAPHCMINRTGTDVIVHEIQEGICREEDNIRYQDASGRAVTKSADEKVLASIDLYHQIMQQILEISADKLAA